MARAVRFVHAADTHLGTAFKGLHTTNPARSGMLRKAINDAFESVIDQAINLKVDFVCFAGDIYNSETKNLAAQVTFRNGVQRLADAGIRVFMVGGNHDPIGAEARLPLPSNIHVFDTEKVERVLFSGTENDPTQTCALYGRSYKTAEENTNFAVGFKHDGAADNAIGILHTNVGSQSTHERYARCTIADLEAANMDYWALGHIHLPQVLKDSQPMIVYPGSTQALQINETGDRGCELVTLDHGHASRKRLKTGQVSFHQVAVDVSSCSNIATLASAIESTIIEELVEPEDTGRIVRVTFTGVRQFALDEIVRDPDELIEITDVLLNGSLPQTYLDGRILDRTTTDVSTKMLEDSNRFIRSILDEVYDDSRALLGEIIAQDQHDIRKDIKKIDSDLLADYGEGEFIAEGISENLISGAKEQLYRMLSGKDYS